MANPQPVVSYELHFCNTYNKLSVFEDHYEVTETVYCFCGAFRLFQALYNIPKHSVLFVTRAYRNPTTVWRLLFYVFVGLALGIFGSTGNGLEFLWAVPAAAIIALVVYLVLSDRILNVNVAIKHTNSYFGPRQFFLQLSNEDAYAAFNVLSQDQLLLTRQQPSFAYGLPPAPAVHDPDALGAAKAQA
jgi:hypothetical protein